MNLPNHALTPARLIGLLAAVVICAGLTGAGKASAATSWQASVGADANDHAIQANAFLPHELWINVNDTVTWTDQAAEIHTLTFLSGAAAPPLIIPSGPGITFNPAAVVPSGGPDYNGTGIVNSGVLAAPGQTFSLTFTASGDFTFNCLVHATMSGVMHVRPEGTPYPHNQSFYTRQGHIEAVRLLARGFQLAGNAIASAAQSHGVAAGIGELLSTSGIADLRFYPGRRVIRVGETVTWTNRDPETPHTVTFGTEPPGGQLGSFLPVGTDGPGHGTINSTSQSLNSGFIGAGLPFGTQFQATFTKPGVYAYFCALHDDAGMKGQIVVVGEEDN